MTLPLRRILAAGLVTGLSLLVSACLLAPGKFVSTLDLRKDGRFQFTYTGQISMLGLSGLAEMGRKDAGPFTPQPCHGDDGEVTRKCTDAELASQKADWERDRAAAAEKAKKDAETAKALLGGIDPTSPRAAEDMAERLRKQAGWKRVIYKGNGVYEVDFALAGRIDHDFSFPTIERFPMANAFVSLIRRADGSVRIDAPAFGPAAGGSPVGSLAALAAMSGGKDGERLPAPDLDGTFTITTDGQILANNTDDGPVAEAAGLRLGWTINQRTPAAPTALIALTR